MQTEIRSAEVRRSASRAGPGRAELLQKPPHCEAAPGREALLRLRHLLSEPRPWAEPESRAEPDFSRGPSVKQTGVVPEPKPRSCT